MKKITIALIMVISLIAPIQTMAESVTQNGTIIEPLEQNIEQIIDEITSEPRPINSDAIQNVKEYISEYFGNLGYDNIECQKFEYNDENNENAIRRSSQVDVFLAPTAENATIDGTGENIIVTKKSSTDMTKNLIISAHYDSAEDSVGANDNGSGVAAVLELARILKDTEIPYNIKFILFSGEEKYMLGSRWYVGKLTEDERAALEEAVIQLQRDQQGEKLAQSYAGRIGKAVAVIIRSNGAIARPAQQARQFQRVITGRGQQNFPVAVLTLIHARIGQAVAVIVGGHAAVARPAQRLRQHDHHRVIGAR